MVRIPLPLIAALCLPILLAAPLRAQTLPTQPLPMQPSTPAARPPRTPQPLLVAIEYDPWLWLRWSDSPFFALYDDGTVIYRVKQGIATEYLTTTIPMEHVARLLADTLPYLSLRGLPTSLSVTQSSDPPLNRIAFVGEGNHYASVDVAGYLRDSGAVAEERRKAPAAFMAVYDYASAFRSPDARPWLPERIEVVLAPREKADSTLPWPADFPALDDPTTRRGTRLASIYVPSTRYAELKELAARLAPGQGILLGGGLWYLQTIRFPFPGEPIWSHR